MCVRRGNEVCSTRWLAAELPMAEPCSRIAYQGAVCWGAHCWTADQRARGGHRGRCFRLYTPSTKDRPSLTRISEATGHRQVGQASADSVQGGLGGNHILVFTGGG